MSRSPMTREGFEKLQEKLKHLKEVELPRIQVAIGVALDHGDISENSELDAAREEAARTETFISELEAKLAGAMIVEADQLPKNEIVIGATVTLEDLMRGGEFTYLLVGEGELRDDVETISVGAPLGEAIVGKNKGDEVEFQGPRGLRRYKIVSYEYK